ncbi:MAG TPA: hypothetical protein VJ692_15470 [Nitrospiraceae bacterium]|nr:hypothetical protein [Nitrospiraceae bacterium]
MTLVVFPKKIAMLLAVVIVGLIGGHIFTQYMFYGHGHDYQFGFLRLFDLGGENNISSWFASFTLLACSFLLALIGLTKKRSHDRHAFHWLVLAGIFLYLSLDEAASIHEMIEMLIPADRATGYLFYPWVIAGGLFVLIVSMAFFRFLVALPSDTRRLFIIAGILYVGGALGIELVGAKHDFHYGKENLVYAMLVMVEEGLEMAGVATFLYALSSYMATHAIGVHFVMSSAHRETPAECR